MLVSEVLKILGHQMQFIRVAKAIILTGGVTGAGYGGYSLWSVDEKMEKIDWLESWAKQNGNCKIHMVLERSKKQSYDVSHTRWKLKQLKEVLKSVTVGSRVNEMSSICKRGKILRLVNNSSEWEPLDEEWE